MKALAIVFIVLGLVLGLALIPVGAWWLGLLLALCGLMVLVTMNKQQARARPQSPPALEWLAYDGQLDVVGESHRTDVISQINAAAPNQELVAVLIPDVNNEYDKNAVGVAILHDEHQKLVGYLPHEMASTVRPLVDGYVARNVLPAVKAWIREFETDDAVIMYQVTIKA